MARVDIKVNLPIGNPDSTLWLMSRILTRNTLLGVNSPIKDDFDFVQLDTDNTAIKLIVNEAKDAGVEAERKHGRLLQVLGTAPAQNLKTLGTLYTETTRIRDILLVKHQGNPEELEAWGFNVVVTQTDGRRNVRVDLPTDNPGVFAELCFDINAKHVALGVNSPLTGKIDMTAYGAKATEARDTYQEAVEQTALKEAKNGEAMNFLGYAEGQTSETPDTVYNFITNARDLLLVAYHENPDELSVWGYNVVVGETATGPQEGTPATP